MTSTQAVESLKRATGRRRPSPFLQMLTIFLKQDLRFPILEGFAFVFVLSAFFFGVLNQSSSASSVAVSYVTIVMDVSLLIFMVLIWRNVSSGLGTELEKGPMQTFLTYPLSRGRLYIARVLSSVGIPLLVFISSQLLAIAVVDPAFAVRESGTFWLMYLGVFGTPMLITALILVIAVLSKQGGLPLVAGIFLYFFLGLFVPIFVEIARSYHNVVAIGALSILNPATPVADYLTGSSCSGLGCNPPPTLLLAQEYLAACYLLTAALFVLGYFLFRTEVEA